MDSYIVSAVTIVTGTVMFMFIEDTTHLSYPTLTPDVTFCLSDIFYGRSDVVFRETG